MTDATLKFFQPGELFEDSSEPALSVAADAWGFICWLASAPLLLVAAFARRDRQRRELTRLARLDDRLLADVGLVRSDVETKLTASWWAA